MALAGNIGKNTYIHTYIYTYIHIQKIRYLKPGGGSGFRFFQKWVWRQKKSAKLGTRDGKVRYLPGANKIEDVQTSCGAGAGFVQNVCGSKSFRSVSEHETGK